VCILDFAHLLGQRLVFFINITYNPSSDSQQTTELISSFRDNFYRKSFEKCFDISFCFISKQCFIVPPTHTRTCGGRELAENTADDANDIGGKIWETGVRFLDYFCLNF
jgi:hypothetical protein